MHYCLPLFILLLLSPCGTLAADANAWRSRNIYFALTDRIARFNDDSTSPCSNLGKYCGGAFAGMQSKLDYIQNMGFDAIWITPVVSNSDDGYHGYWAKDLYSINQYYGSSEDLKALVDAAHSKGMFIMADVGANHMGTAPVIDDLPEPLNQTSSYHSPCTINHNDQSSIENCWIADNLPDVYTTKPEIRSLYQTWVSWLVQTYGFDGLRIDTVKHVEKDFWPPFVSASGVFAIGEVLDGNPTYVAGYQSSVPGLLNYPVYYPLTRAFLQQGSFQDLVNMHDRVGSTFSDPTLLGNFVDNHDNPRFLNSRNDHAVLTNALAYVILARGIPVVYYGTEQGFSGGNDPANREDLWRSRYSTSTDLYQSISKLSAARLAAGGLSGNDHTHLYVGSNIYAWSRVQGKLIVVTSNSGSDFSGSHCFATQTPAGTQWNDTFGQGSYTADGTGRICVNIGGGLPVVLLQDSDAS